MKSRYLRYGQHGVDRTETNLGDYLVSFLPEARTRGIEHLSMRSLASTQSKYDGPNHTTFAAFKTPYYSTTVILSIGKKSGHNHWQMDHQKAMDAKKEEYWNAANTLLYWTDGRTTKYTERLNWYTVGLTSGSSTSTTSPTLTSAMMHLTDSDYDVKTQSVWETSIPINKQDHCVKNLFLNHQQMHLVGLQRASRQ